MPIRIKWTEHTGQTAEAIGAPVPLRYFAAAVPFVVIASVIALTPGGLGVNELTFATALKVSGTPLARGAQRALADRVFLAVSYYSVAIGATTILLVERGMVPSRRDATQDR